MSTAPEIQDRIERALLSSDPISGLVAIAVELRDRGSSKESVLSVFDVARQRHHDDKGDKLYDCILDVMDQICGSCHPDRRIFT
jgi:hypothetical protein